METKQKEQIADHSIIEGNVLLQIKEGSFATWVINLLSILAVIIQ